jgi:hypothetical protein
MNALPLLVAAALLGVAPVPAGDQQALMARIEARVVMPRGADPIAGYRRTYAWDPHAPPGSRVLAVYMRTDANWTQRLWVAADQLPVVMDGGCGIVTLTYDVANDRVERIGCNGLA